MKKIFLIMIFATLVLISIIFIPQEKTTTPKATYTIGILQTASHPALDAACQGFMQELENLLGSNVAFTVKNIQGSVSQAHAIAQQFHTNKKYSGFFTIATPATQALITLEKERPIFIAAVTNPHALGIIDPKTNVCGTKDMIDVKAEIKLLTQLIPTAKTVALIYTTGEANSIFLVKEMREELKKRDLIPLDFAVGSEIDLPALVDLACRKADVLLTPTDNTIASSISLITSIAKNYNKPLIVSDTMLVKQGALASQGVDYKESGKQTARIAYQVLVQNKKPYELPIEQASTNAVYINKKALHALGLTVPESLKNEVTLIEDSHD